MNGTGNSFIQSINRAWNKLPGPVADLVLFVLVPTIIRLLLISRFELCEDETYYWQWARHLDFGYHDQGPGVAIAIRIGTALFGSTEFGVRFMAVILFAFSLVITYLLMQKMYHRSAARISLLLMNIIPVFSLGAILMMHEAVQGFFWSLAIYSFWMALGIDDKAGQSGAGGRQIKLRQTLLWILTGLSIGFGFDGKYTMILFMPAAFFLLTFKEQRHWLKRPEPYLAALAALAAVSPVLYWNNVHDWQSVRQILSLGNRSSGMFINPLHFLELAGGQFGLISPILFGLVIWRLAVAWREGVRGKNIRSRFLFSFAAFYAGPFLVWSWHSYIYTNWPALGWTTGILLLAHWASEERLDAGVRLQLWWSIGVRLALIITALIYIQAIVHLPLSPNPKTDAFNRFFGWSQLGERVDAIQKEQEKKGRPVFLYARNYQIASELAFYAPGQPRVYEMKREGRANQYDYWPDLPQGSNALLVLYGNRPAPQKVYQIFQEVTELPPLVIEKFGREQKSFSFYLCKNYLE